MVKAYYIWELQSGLFIAVIRPFMEKYNKAKRRKEKISIKDDSYSNDIESC